MKLLIIGGVAGGMAAAARARRLSEQAEIIVFERGEYVSFANCGLPYYAGGVIEDRDALLVQTPAALKKRFNLVVRVKHEVTAIDPQKRSVTVRDIAAGREYTESYDDLILAPGAEPFVPPVPGVDLPAVYRVRTVPDIDRVKAHLDAGTVKRAVVVGAGFIGIEMAENLVHRGAAVTVVEMLDQVLPALDREMAALLHEHLTRNKVTLKLGERLASINAAAEGLVVRTASGAEMPADMVIMAVGVRPETKLAAAAGLKLGKRGITVDEHMRTSDPHIYAVGDAVETLNPVLGIAGFTPLAGPAARQARVAADTICGRPAVYGGTIGTAIMKVFNLTAAVTGASEAALKLTHTPYLKVYTHPASHVGYYPGGSQLTMKVLFAPDKGTVLGAQIVGADGVDKRIDVLAVAVKHKLTVRDLAALELAYAPPYGSVKDPVNLAGTAAANHLDGLTPLVHWDGLTGKELLLDVRTPAEVEAGAVPGAVNIPVDSLRQRLAEIPRDKTIAVFCRVGIRAHAAVRILRGNGYDAVNVSGGWLSYCQFHPAPVAGGPCASATRPVARTEQAATTGEPAAAAPVRTIDFRGLQCPGPVIQLKQALEKLGDGQAVSVLASDPGFARDVATWCESTGNRLVSLDAGGPVIKAVVARGQAPAGGQAVTGNATTLVVFSGDLDKAYAAFIIARGAAAAGWRVTMFFTFWGLNILRRVPAPSVKKDFLSRMFGWMMPSSVATLKLSKLNMAGMGTAMMKLVMRNKGVESLPVMLRQARAEGVKIIACSMTMDVMGISA
ncbi:MAG: FAD-dependent oxidoreductase, partial [Planctomycetota bacterium]